MKRNITKPLQHLLPVVAVGCMALFSCKKILDVGPETSLTSQQVYRNVFDADAAVIGTYGKLMGLARQYVVLNELRADLMEITENADASLREVNVHSVQPGNPYADPRPFYAVINNCNDVLKNFDIMKRDNKMTETEYNQRYSDIGALRSWLYLQLGIHFGNVPYVTDPLATIEDVKDPAKYPRLEFTKLLDQLISFTESLPWKNPYLPGTSLLVINVDGSISSRFYIEKNALLGDLHLWKASADPGGGSGHYTQAATYYRKVMDQEGYFVNPAAEQGYNQFRVSSFGELMVSYTKSGDIFSLVDNNATGWRSIFGRSQDAMWTQEWIWVLPFNSNFAPENPFIDLFSNNGGRYLVKPSKVAIDNWNSQTQSNNLPYDARGLMTYKTIGGQPVITKYLYHYLDATSLAPVNALQKNGQWFLLRAPAVHLRFAEAANRDGRHRLAAGLLNNGLTRALDTSTAAGRDVTNVQHSLWENVPAYRFEARNGEVPRYRDPWYRNAGIRGRASVQPIAIPASDSMTVIENALLNEGALELAYEGYRWPDLLRHALRNNNSLIVANAVSNKLSKDGIGDANKVKIKLENRQWYLPFNW